MDRPARSFAVLAAIAAASAGLMLLGHHLWTTAPGGNRA